MGGSDEEGEKVEKLIDEVNSAFKSDVFGELAVQTKEYLFKKLDENKISYIDNPHIYDNKFKITINTIVCKYNETIFETNIHYNMNNESVAVRIQACDPMRRMSSNDQPIPEYLDTYEIQLYLKKKIMNKELEVLLDTGEEEGIDVNKEDLQDYFSDCCFCSDYFVAMFEYEAEMKGALDSLMWMTVQFYTTLTSKDFLTKIDRMSAQVEVDVEKYIDGLFDDIQ
ncbi:hypothetical protein ACFL1H_04060 [Nanoarchaeota archaeon]